MKRTISGSVLKAKSPNETETLSNRDPEDQELSSIEFSESPITGIKPRMGGSGSAWKAGALSDTQALLDEKRSEVVENILGGRQELQLRPDQIEDKIGSDRRGDWIEQEAFRSLYESIEQNGQDTPVQVWPVDPNWQPDPLDPESCDDASFYLVTGRRRHAIATQLGRTVRAVLANSEKRKTTDDQFEMLFMRFRENEERENLGAFERLLSIGEMFERYVANNPGKKNTAAAFSEMIGVHESHVSRGKTVVKVHDEILHACKNVYDLSYRELEKVVSSLTVVARTKPKPAAKAKKITVTRKMGSRKLSLSSQGGKLAVSAAGLNLDKPGLEGLSDVIAAYLEKRGSDR